MHRLLMDAKDGEIIDHINGNRSDNRLSNLRKSDTSLNGHNKTKQNGLTSKYIGVCRAKSGKYTSAIRKGTDRYHLGTFKTEEEAALAYNEKAKEIYGEFANLNEIESM
jgi:hypothetical protein